MIFYPFGRVFHKRLHHTNICKCDAIKVSSGVITRGCEKVRTDSLHAVSCLLLPFYINSETQLRTSDIKDKTPNNRTSENSPTLWLNIPYLGKNGDFLIKNLEKKLKKSLSDFNLKDSISFVLLPYFTSIVVNNSIFVYFYSKAMYFYVFLWDEFVFLVYFDDKRNI